MSVSPRERADRVRVALLIQADARKGLANERYYRDLADALPPGSLVLTADQAETVRDALTRLPTDTVAGREFYGQRVDEALALLSPEASEPVIPDDCCPVCTKDLEADGWCFECRIYPRAEANVETKPKEER